MGRQFSRLLAAELFESAVVMLVMLGTPCSEVECKTPGYPLHSHVSPSFPLPCVIVYHHISTELYNLTGTIFLALADGPDSVTVDPGSKPDQKYAWWRDM